MNLGLVLGGFVALGICQACMTYVCAHVLTAAYSGRPLRRQLILSVLLAALPGTLCAVSWLLAPLLSLAVSCYTLGRLFVESWPKKIAIILLAGSLNVGATYAGWALLDVVAPRSAEPLLFKIVIFSCLDMLLAAASTALLTRKTASTAQKGKYALIVCWCLELVVCCLYILNVRHNRPDMLLWSSVGVILLAVCFGVMTLFYARILRQTRIREERQAAAEASLKLQEARFAEISDMLTATRRLRHDFNNHIMVICALAREGKREDAMQYLQHLREQLEQQCAKEDF